MLNRLSSEFVIHYYCVSGFIVEQMLLHLQSALHRCLSFIFKHIPACFENMMHLVLGGLWVVVGICCSVCSQRNQQGHSLVTGSTFLFSFLFYCCGLQKNQPFHYIFILLCHGFLGCVIQANRVLIPSYSNSQNLAELHSIR